MGEAYRGLTIQFKADGTKVMSTLRSMTRAANQVESELRMVKKALRFDSGSTKAAQANMTLLAEKASAVRAEVVLAKRRMAELGKVDFGGVKMKQLSERTQDVSTKAQMMSTRYARATEELAKLHDRATEAWSACKLLEKVRNPFEGEAWSELSTAQIQKYITIMKRVGAVTDEEAAQMRGAVAALRQEFGYTGSELKKLNNIAEYQSFGNHIVRETAKAKAAMDEMVKAAKNLGATGFEGVLESSRASVERLKASASKIDEAMKLNPANLKLFDMQLKAVEGSMDALEGEGKALRAEMVALGKTKGVKELASDMGTLSKKMLSSQESLEKAASELANVKGEALAAKERVDELKNSLRVAGGKDLDIARQIGEANISLFKCRAEVERVEQAWRESYDEAQLYAKAVRYADDSMKLLANDAAVVAARVKAATEARPTRLASQIKSLDASLDAASNAAAKFKSAFKLDPTSTEKAVQYAAALSRQYDIASTKANALKLRVDALSKDASVAEMASSMKPLPTILENVKNKMGQVATEAQQLSGRIDENKNKLKGLEAGTKEFDELKAKISADEAALAKLNTRFAQLKSQHAGVAAANELREVKAQAAEATAAVDKTVAEMRKLKSSSFPASSLTNIGMSFYSTLTPAFMALRTYALQSAKDVDSAYRDMRKTVQGTEEDFEALKKSALEFGTTHFTSADQILEIEAMGGQLGIMVENLESFATTVSNIAIASDSALDADTAAVSLGKLATVLGLSAEEYDNFADSLVRLGNSEAAMESDILGITTRWGAMGKIVGMSADQILGWSTAATVTGMRVQAAGSSMQRMFSLTETAVTKGGEKLALFAQTAGMTADEFKKAFEEDASGAMYQFISGLGTIQSTGKDLSGVLTTVNQRAMDLGFGNVYIKQLVEGLALQMANASEETNVLSDSLEMADHAYRGVSDRWGDAGDAANEARKKSEGFSGTLQQIINVGQQFAESLGVSVLPIFTAFLDAARVMVDAFSALPLPVRTVMLATTLFGSALGPILTTIGALAPLMKEFGSSNAVMAITSKKAAKEADALSKEHAKAAESFNKAAIAARKEADSLIEEAMAAERSAAGTNEAASASEKLSLAANKEAEANEKAALAARERAAAEEQAAASASFSAKNIKAQTGMLTGLKSLGKMVGAFAAFELVVMGISAIGSKIAETVENVQVFQKSTVGLNEAAQSISIGLDGMADSFGAVSKSGKTAADVVGDATRKNAELADSILARNESAQSEIDMLNRAKAIISEYMESTSHTSGEMGQFKQAIETVNALCDRQYTVVDLVTGAIQDESGAIVNINSELMNLIATTEASIRSQALMDDLTEGLAAQGEAVKAVAVAYADLMRVQDDIASGAMGGDVAELTLNDAEARYRRAQEELSGVNAIVDTTEQALGSVKAVTNGMNATAVDFANSMTTLSTAVKTASGENGWGTFLSMLGDAGVKLSEFKALMSDNGKQLDLALWFNSGSRSMDDFKSKLKSLGVTTGVESSKVSGVVGNMTKSVNTAMATSSDAIDDTDESLDEFSMEAEAANTAIDKLVTNVPSIENAFRASGLSLEEFSDAMSLTGVNLEEMAQTAEETAKKVSDGLNAISVNQEMTFDQYRQNLEENTRIVSDWGNNLKTLYQSTDNETTKEWLRSLAEAGPEQAALVADMVGRSTDELDAAAGQWKAAAEAGWQGVTNASGVSADEVVSSFNKMKEGTSSAFEGIMTPVSATIEAVSSATGGVLGAALGASASMVSGFEASAQKARDAGSEVEKVDRLEVADKSFDVNVNDYASWTLKSIKSMYDALVDKTVYITVKKRTSGSGGDEGGSAMGGVSRVPLEIPRNASGGLSGIATQAILTNQGWVGEDGDEALIPMGKFNAIVPLTNRRYVRPFAQAVASEMRGGYGNRSEVHYHNTYYVNADAVTDERVIGAVELIVDRATQFQEAM